MPLIRRTNKGAPLTFAEMDSNLDFLNQVFVQDTAPTGTSGPYIWVQTNYKGVPGKFTVWIGDGT